MFLFKLMIGYCYIGRQINYNLRSNYPELKLLTIASTLFYTVNFTSSSEMVVNSSCSRLIYKTLLELILMNNS